MSNPYERLKDLPNSPSVESAYCGPASLNCILNYFGINANQRELAVIMEFDPEWGTTPDGWIKAAKQMGLFAIALTDASFEAIEYIADDQGIAVVDFIDRDPDGEFVAWDYGHYSVYRGRSFMPFEEINLICDYRPNRGQFQVPRWIFEKYWWDIDKLDGIVQRLNRWAAICFKSKQDWENANYRYHQILSGEVEI